MSKPRVMLAIPGYRVGFSKAAGAADRVIVEAMQDELLATIERPIGMNIHQARNYLFTEAVSREVTHLFFLDDDVDPPPHVIKTLLNANVGVIGGAYPIRVSGRKRCAAWDWDSRGSAELFPWSKIDGDSMYPNAVYPRIEPLEERDLWQDLQLVGGIGTGCMLISIEVIKLMLETYKTPFQSPDELGPNGEILNVSDDVYFANRLREMGIAVVLNKTVICKHYGVVELGEESKD